MQMEGDSLNPFALWAKSIGLTPYEQTSIRDGSGRSYRSSRRRGRRSGHNGDTTHADEDEDELNPSFHSSRRSSTLLAATLQMIGSNLGVGILVWFLPARTPEDQEYGPIPTFPNVPPQQEQYPYWLMVALAAMFVTERSTCLTILNSRYAGVNYAPDLIRVALGPTVHQWHAMVSVAFYLLALVCLQMVLLEIGHSILFEINHLVAQVSEAYDEDDARLSALDEERNLLPLILATFGCILVVSPMLFQREFRWIRTHLVTILITTVILATSACYDVDKNRYHNQIHMLDSSVLRFDWWLLMLYSTQALKVQNTLKQPTRRRMSWVVTLSVVCTGILFLLLERTMAVWHPSEQTNSDVDSSVSVIYTIYTILGRVGCVASLLLTYGLHMPYTRRMVLHIVEFSFIDKSNPNQCRLVKDICPDECCDEDAEDEETCVSFPSISTWSTSKSHVDVIQLAPDEETMLLPRIEEGLEPCNVYTNAFAHYSSTTGIVLVTFGLACLLYMAKVSAWSVWQWIAVLFAPSSVLAMPAACFLCIQGRQAFLPWRVLWIGFSYLSLFLAFAVSLVAFVQLFYDDILSSPALYSFLNTVVFLVQ